MTNERLCFESSIFPIIMTISLLVECQQDYGTVGIFPFTGEDMAVTGLRLHRWGKGIRGNIPMNRWLDASCCE